MDGKQEACAWPWWWSTDEERYRGPCSSRADAIMEAWAEDTRGSVHVMQAEHGDVNYCLWDASQIAEQFDEANYEMGDPEGDGLSVGFNDGDFEYISKQLEGAVRAMVRKRGVTAYAFARQTCGEWIDLTQPALSALPPEARHILADLAACWANDSYEGYVDQQIADLKLVLHKPRSAIAKAVGSPNASEGDRT